MDDRITLAAIAVLGVCFVLCLVGTGISAYMGQTPPPVYSTVLIGGMGYIGGIISKFGGQQPQQR